MSDLPTRADYSDVLNVTDKWHTAQGVPLGDMNRLTHQLRYQAEKLGLEIQIETNKTAHTVSFRTKRSG